MDKQKAKSIRNNKLILPNGVIVEIKIWKVSKGKRYPTGYKYSLYGVFESEVLVGYDNHYPKGHHRHVENREIPYLFSNLKVLVNDFKSDLEIQMAKRGLS